MAIEVVTEFTDIALGNRRGLLEGLAAEFLRETGLKASECELVEQRDGPLLRWHFRKRPELQTRDYQTVARGDRLVRVVSGQSASLACPHCGTGTMETLRFGPGNDNCPAVCANGHAFEVTQPIGCNIRANKVVLDARERIKVDVRNDHAAYEDPIDEVPESLEGWPCSAGFAPRVSGQHDNRTLNVKRGEITDHDLDSALDRLTQAVAKEIEACDAPEWMKSAMSSTLDEPATPRQIVGAIPPGADSSLIFTCHRCKLPTHGVPADYIFADAGSGAQLQPLCGPCAEACHANSRPAE